MKCARCNFGTLIAMSRWYNSKKLYDFYECDFCRYMPENGLAINEQSNKTNTTLVLDLSSLR